MNIQKEKNLTFLTTMKTKCIAEQFVEVETKEELLEAIRYATDNKLSVLMLGGGSNTIILKERVDGLVIKNRYTEKEVVSNSAAFVDIRVSSGYVVARLVSELIAAGYEGLESHIGLPGTVGGAIYMNSKWTHPVSYFGDSLIFATIADPKGITRQVDKDYFHFGYDTSVLQSTEEYLIDATFRLVKTSPDILKARSREVIDYRNQTQPVSRATSGCFFQNIGAEEQRRLGLKTASAGYLIDQSGMKGKRVGSFVVSQKHANFIIDEGEGNPEDLKILMDEVKKAVHDKFGVSLKEEIRVVI